MMRKISLIDCSTDPWNTGQYYIPLAPWSLGKAREDGMMKRLFAILLLTSLIIVPMFIPDGEAINSEDTVLEGWVRDWSGRPMANITIEVLIGNHSQSKRSSDPAGHYRMAFMEAFTNYTIAVYSDWTSNFTTNIMLTLDNTTYLNCSVEYLPLGGLEGRVELPDGGPAYGVGVHYIADGVPPLLEFTDVLGNYAFDVVQEGECELMFELGGYETITVSNITISPHRWNHQDMVMTETPFDISILPLDGSKDVPVNSSIMIGFGRPIDPGSIDGSSIFLINEDTGAVIPSFFTIEQGSMMITLVSEQLLFHNTSYIVHLTTGIIDIWEKHLPFNYTSNFRTGIFIEPVTVHSTYPRSDSSDIPVDIEITVEFKTSLDLMTIDQTTFFLYLGNDANHPIQSDVKYFVEEKKAVLIPDEPLEHSRRYAVSLSDEIEYEDRTKTFPGHSWTFETEPPPVMTGTVIGYVLDETNAPIISTNAVIRLENRDQVYAQYPDPNGRYVFHDIPPGEFNLTIRADGYEMEHRTIYVELGDPTMVDTIRMVENTEDIEAAEDIMVMVIVLIIAVIISVMVITAVITVRAKSDEKNVQVEGHERPSRQVSTMNARKPLRHEIISIHDDTEDDVMEDVIMEELIDREMSKNGGDRGHHQKPKLLEAPPGF